MRKVNITIISLLLICFVGWSFVSVAAKYDQTVYDAQKRLQELGYNPGTVDGKIGKKTEDAIRKFQQDSGILVTGTLNEETIQKLGLGPQTEETNEQEKGESLQRYQLRNEAMTVSKDNALETFRLKEVDFGVWTGWQPLTYIENDYETKTIKEDKVVIDHATGLMWQKSEATWLQYEEAQEYIKLLNREQFAGYNDWRMPTIPELLSLVEPEEFSTNMYGNNMETWYPIRFPLIDPIFDAELSYDGYWSSDRTPEGIIWVIKFDHGVLDSDGTDSPDCVRAVRQNISLVPITMPATTMPAPTATPQHQTTYYLHNTPQTVSESDVPRVFETTSQEERDWVPRLYIDNQYEDQGSVVVDHATGLMWQKSGSPDQLTDTDAQAYVAQLNSMRFASYDDWRLPTIPELMSLIEPTKKHREGTKFSGLTRQYIDPIFDPMQDSCWSTDKRLSGESWASEPTWIVNFHYGTVRWSNMLNYVRAVRSLNAVVATPVPPTPTATPVSPPQHQVVHHLRSTPQTVSIVDYKQVFGLTTDRETPRLYIDNQYENLGYVVIDHATGLMWQKSGMGSISYTQIQMYIAQLNITRFAGYDDWRLPTIPELMSLMEPEQQSNGLYINPIFSSKPRRLWSADRLSGGSSSEWYVDFYNGFVSFSYEGGDGLYVRAVRPWH